MRKSVICDIKRRGSTSYTAALLSPSHGLWHYVSVGRSIRKVQGQQCFRTKSHRATSMLLMELMSSFSYRMGKWPQPSPHYHGFRVVNEWPQF